MDFSRGEVLEHRLCGSCVVKLVQQFAVHEQFPMSGRSDGHFNQLDAILVPDDSDSAHALTDHSATACVPAIPTSFLEVRSISGFI